MTTILVVDDEKAARFALRRVLEKDFDVLEAESGEQALVMLEKQAADLVVLDLNMPGMGGLEALLKLREREDAPPVLILTAHGSERIAVDAMKRGAADYLPKPYDVDELRLVARRAIEHAELERENRKLKTALRSGAGLGQIIGDSPSIKRVLEVVGRVAPLDATVLIEGESGTGKELVARELHRRSPRAAKPFVALNCAALPEGLVESELFGHERGAFTGATGVRKGRFEMAQGGTLFLDEIGEAPAALQAKLLRVLETKRFERVGGADLIQADVRLIAATNRDLKAQAGAGKFREDLYYRLKVVDIVLPSLRARGSDVALLARHFAEIASTKYGLPAKPLSGAAVAALVAYPWPGNVRELAHVMEKGVILAPGARIELDDLPGEVVAALPKDFIPVPEPAAVPVPEPVPDSADETEDAGDPGAAPALPDIAPLVEAEAGSPFADAKRRAMVRFETELISRELARSRGNVSKAARGLGLHRQSLQHKLKELGIDAERYRDPKE